MTTRLRVPTSGTGPATADDFGGPGSDGSVLSRVGNSVEWDNSPNAILAQTKFPTGFENRTDSAIAFDDATRTFTIAPTGASYGVWYHGRRLVKSAPNAIVWPDTQGLQAVYFDGTGVIQATNDPNALANIFGGNGIPIAAFYWDAAANQTLRRIEERHDTSLPPAVHAYLHQYVGTVLESGGAFSNFTITGGAGDLAVNAQFGVGDCVVADEDIRWPIVNGAPQTLAPVAQIPMFYLSGPGDGLWLPKTADTFPIIYSGTGGYVGPNGRLPWNEFAGGAWGLAEVTNADFVLGHYYASTDLRLPVFGIQGQAIYTTAALARAGANRELANIRNLNALLSTEKRALGSVIFQTAAAYLNVPKAKVVLTDTGANYVDWRTTPVFTGVILA